jgi:hypothetical protein
MELVLSGHILRKIEDHMVDIKADIFGIRNDLWKVIEHLKEQDWLDENDLEELIEKLEDICYELA